jgi:hypothetical protein
MKKLLDIDQEMRSHEDTLNNLHQALMRGEVVVRHHAYVPSSFHNFLDRKTHSRRMKPK